jgi:glycine oxidase
MAATADVVIVGGGIIGCAIAFELAKAGARPLVLERAEVGAEASSGAAGLLTAQSHSDEPDALFELKIVSRGLYPDLAREFLERVDVDIELRELGHLVPAFAAEDAAAIRSRIAWQAARGLPAEWLDERAARAFEPGLSPQAQGAGWFPLDHHVNNTAVTQAFAVAARRLGGQVRTGCTVVDLCRQGDRITGVRTATETVAAPLVVLAAGAWSGDFAEAASIPVPVGPAKGQIVVARLPRPATHTTVHAETYSIPRASGEHILGSTVEFVGFDKGTTPEGIAAISAETTRAVPALKDAEMVASWGCLRPATPDGMPLLGPVRPGLILATGHFRNGILLAPITGKLIAEAVLTGRVPARLSAFRPDRPFPSSLPKT